MITVKSEFCKYKNKIEFYKSVDGEFSKEM